MAGRPRASEQDARDATVRGAQIAHKGLILTLVGILVSALGIYLGIAATRNYFPFNATSTPIAAACTQTIDPVTDDSSRLRPPTGVVVNWSQSQTKSGHVAAAIHWTNHDRRTTWGLIEVVGRYGTASPNDEPIRTDSRELPGVGLCGDWYRRWTSSDDGERGVFFDGLWPNEKYCFGVNVSDPGGGVHAPFPSIQAIVCDTAPWRSAWGSPATP